MLHQPTTMAAHHRILQDAYARLGVSSLLPSRTTHRYLILGFLKVLADDCDLFACPICSELPHDQLVLLFDAKEMGMQQDLARPYQLPLGDVTAGKRRPAATVDHYAPLKTSQSRALLNKWIKGTCFSDADAVALRSALEHEGSGLWALIQLMCQQQQQQPQQQGNDVLNIPQPCPKEWCQFLKAMAMAYPASSLMSPDYARTGGYQRLCTDGELLSAADVAELHSMFPMLHNFLLECRVSGWNSNPPQELRKVVQQLVGAAQHLAACPPQPDLPVPDPSIEDTHVFMPAFPLCRALPRYEGREKPERGADDACRKYENGHTRLTPGVLLMFCAHGICLGFKLMARCEGPGMVADLLYTRLKAAPKLVVYDNACNVHRICMRWHPDFFNKTRFLIDRVHQFNHHSCGPGYNMGFGNQSVKLVDGVTVGSLNSQAAEQRNSMLEKIRTSFAYKSHDTGFRYMKRFLGETNRKKISSVRDG